MSLDFTELSAHIKAWALALGFSQVGITNCDTDDANEKLQTWLQKQYHGEMQYMEKNRELRQFPEKLLPGTVRIISVRMDYLTENHQSLDILSQKQKAYISRYALCCPWNKFAHFTNEKDFQPRHHLKDADLIELFAWDEKTFLKKTEGSAIRRAGYMNWLRNIAIALGNAPASLEIIAALRSRENHESEIVREHVAWALRNYEDFQ